MDDMTEVCATATIETSACHAAIVCCSYQYQSSHHFICVRHELNGYRFPQMHLFKMVAVCRAEIATMPSSCGWLYMCAAAKVVACSHGCSRELMLYVLAPAVLLQELCCILVLTLVGIFRCHLRLGVAPARPRPGYLRRHMRGARSMSCVACRAFPRGRCRVEAV